MKNNKIRIVYLYAEIMSYNVAVFREYVNKYNAEVHVVHWDEKKKTPYVAPQIDCVYYYSRSRFNSASLTSFVLDINPDVVYTSGWMDGGYIKTCLKLRAKEIPTVAVSDTQYYNTVRQNIGRFFFKLFYKKSFSYIWVAGSYQYEYAKKLGFKNDEIIFNFLSADLSLFNGFFNQTISLKRKYYPRQFLYAGRFSHEKGLDLLISAWSSIQDKKGWSLCLVGNGDLKEKLLSQADIKVMDFVQPEEYKNILAQSGCFILPSIKEPWALVLHEFSAAGLPIICSDSCGSMPTFVISGYNGFVFKNKNVEELKAYIEKIISMDEEQLVDFSIRSHKLGQRINPETVAANSLSILN